MQNSKYLLGLVGIISVVWLTMIFCFIIIYFLLSSIEFSSITYIDKLLLNTMWLLLAGLVFLGWLYSWNMLVRVYFRRNLNKGETKRKEPTSRKEEQGTGQRHAIRRRVS
jgi:polyferredoxin